MATRKLSLELDLDAGTFHASINKASVGVDKFNRGVDKMSDRVNKAEKQIPGLTARVRDLTLILSQARTALYNLRVVFVGWIEQVVKANVEIERMSYLLAGMSDQLSEVGRSREAADNISNLIDMAKTSPFALNALTDSFVKLKSAGIDPMNGSMRSLVDATAAFGGSEQQLHRASIAIQQMAGKGVISMEELRQQLGEAVPSAVKLMARSVGLSYGDLVDLISKGSVESEYALEAMFFEFERTFGGAASNLVNSFAGSMALLRTAITEVSLEMGGFNRETGKFTEGGFMDELKNSLNELVAALNTAEVKQFAKEVGTALADGVRWFTSAVKTAIQYKEVIISLGKAIALYLGASVALSAVRTLMAGMGSLGRAFTVAAAQSRILASEMRASAAMMATTKSASDRLAISVMATNAAFRTLRTVMLSALGPIGMAVAAIFVIVDALGFFKKKTDEAAKAYKEFNEGFVSQDGIDATRESISRLESQLESMRDQLKRNAVKDYINPKTGLVSYRPLTDSERDQLIRQIENQEKRIVEAKQRLSAMREKFDKEAAGREASERIARLERDFDTYQAAYNLRATELADQRDDLRSNEELSEKERLAKQDEIRQQELANIKVYIENRRKLLDQMQTEAVARVEEAQNEAARNAAKTYLAEISEFIRSQRESLDAMLAHFDSKKLVVKADDEEVDGASKKVDQFANLIRDLQAELVGLKSAQNGAADAAAELRSQLEGGRFGVVSDEDIEKAVRLKQEIEEIRQRVRDANSDQRISDQGSKELSRIVSDMRVAEKQAAGIFDESAQAVARIKQRYQELIDKVSQGNDHLRQALELERQQAIEAQRRTDALNAYANIREEKERLEIEMIEDVKARREAAFQLEARRIRESIDLTQFQGEERKRIEKEVQEYIEILRERMERENKTRTQQMLEDWTKTSEAMDNATAGWIDSFVDDLVEGEFSFGKFAKSILADILKIILRAQLANAILSAMGQGGAGATAGGGGFSFPSFPTFHTGGIVGEKGRSGKNVHPGVFQFAQRYHSGGVVGLGPNEVPIIAEIGERVLTREQQAAMSSPTVKNQVQVNIINQSGQSMQSEEQNSYFDGEKMIVDVVVNAMSRPGRMRSATREAAKS